MPQIMEQNSLSTLDSSEKFLGILFSPWGKKDYLHKNCIGNYWASVISCPDTLQKTKCTTELKDKKFSRLEIKQLRNSLDYFSGHCGEDLPRIFFLTDFN